MARESSVLLLFFALVGFMPLQKLIYNYLNFTFKSTPINEMYSQSKPSTNLSKSERFFCVNTKWFLTRNYFNTDFERRQTPMVRQLTVI